MPTVLEFLSKKVEMRLILLLATIFLVGAVLLSWAVKLKVQRGEKTGIILAVADFPEEVRRVFTLWFSPSARWEVAPAQPGQELSVPVRGDFQDPGYLLVSRYDGDRNEGIVELVRIHPWAVLHTWIPDAEYITGITKKAKKEWQLIMIPHVSPDGALTATIGASTSRGIARIDACSDVQWTMHDRVYHHSIEQDADGNFWAPYRVSPDPVAKSGGEHGLARLSPSGELLSLVRITDAMIRAGYRYLLYSMVIPSHDVGLMHMNDIQPVLEDGPYWRRGDLFISLRNPSLVLLYRPSSDEVVWAQAGPWIHQHDVEIISPYEISVFSNNSASLKIGTAEDFNEVMIYDFRTDETRSPWRESLAGHKVYTDVAGRATALDNGDVFVEETAKGRLLRVAADGTLRWSYLNRNRDGKVHWLGWSRYLDAATGTNLAQTLGAVNCSAPR